MNDIDESLKYAERWASDGLAIIPKRLKKGEYCGTMSVNMGSAFENLLFKGLIEWRHEVSDPRPTFFRALNVAKDAFGILPLVRKEFENDSNFRQYWDDSDQSPSAIRPWIWFPFPTANILFILLDGKPDADLLQVTPHPDTWDPKRDDDDWHHFLEASIVWGLLETVGQKTFEKILDGGRRERRLSLAVDTYHIYFHLIRRAKQEECDLHDFVARIQDLYRRRKKSEYFRGGSESNGGDGGELTVDFRLAAILRGYGLDHTQITNYLIRPR